MSPATDNYDFENINRTLFKNLIDVAIIVIIIARHFSAPSPSTPDNLKVDDAHSVRTLESRRLYTVPYAKGCDTGFQATRPPKPRPLHSLSLCTEITYVTMTHLGGPSW